MTDPTELSDQLRELLGCVSPRVGVDGPDVTHAAADLIDQQAARIAELEAALEWRPISEAPKSNPRCLVFCPHHSPEITICPDGLIATKREATYWMPLTTPPKEPSE